MCVSLMAAAGAASCGGDADSPGPPIETTVKSDQLDDLLACDAYPQARFVGCRPSFGECVNSCPTRHACSQQQEDCPGPGDLPRDRAACYCLP